MEDGNPHAFAVLSTLQVRVQVPCALYSALASLSLPVPHLQTPRRDASAP